VVAAPAAASWQGLTALGSDTFGLGAWAFLVPLVLDAAALYVASLALEDVLRGDSAVANRGLVWVYALGSAGMNAYHAHHAKLDTSASVFFAAASISAAVLWDRTLKRTRRDELEKGNHLEKRLPKFRALRWLFAPVSTLLTYRFAVLEGLTTPADALAYRYAVKRHHALRNSGLDPLVVIAYSRAAAGRPELTFADWATQEYGQLTPSPRVIEADSPTAGELESGPVDGLATPVPAAELAGLSKAAVVLKAMRAMDANPDDPAAVSVVPAAVEWAAQRGVAIDRSYAYDAFRRYQSKVTAARHNVVSLPTAQEG
jgi:hypothetical protein